MARTKSLGLLFGVEGGLAVALGAAAAGAVALEGEHDTIIDAVQVRVAQAEQALVAHLLTHQFGDLQGSSRRAAKGGALTSCGQVPAM